MAERNRASRLTLVLLMVVGSFALWIGIPAAILWGLGAVVDSRTEHYLLALLAVPPAMVMFAVGLARLNTLYLRLSGFEGAAGDDEEQEEWVPRVRGPLDRILGLGAVIALIALLAWMVLVSASPAAPLGELPHAAR